MNEALLAESLANNNTNAHNTNPSPVILTPVEETNIFHVNKLNSPLITPDDQASNDADSSSSDFHCNTPRDYLGNVNPDTEMIISPLAPTSGKQLTVASANNASLRY